MNPTNASWSRLAGTVLVLSLAACATGGPARGTAKDVAVDYLALALGMAARKGHLEIVKLLLAAGADPAIQSDCGSDVPCTPLDAARAAGHEDTVRVIEAAMKARQ